MKRHGQSLDPGGILKWNLDILRKILANKEN